MQLPVALAQISPVWLDREGSLAKVQQYVTEAADRNCRLVVFGEALVPGYPFWPELTDGARFESALQKDLYAYYLEQAVDIGVGQLQPLCELARERSIAIYLGCIEKASERSHHSLYASLVYISAQGNIESNHRKLCPTHEERLVWSPGDGHGLRVHELDGFRLGGLNCWENWISACFVVCAGRKCSHRCMARQPPQHRGYNAIHGQGRALICPVCFRSDASRLDW
jgi:nitrilase